MCEVSKRDGKKSMSLLRRRGYCSLEACVVQEPKWILNKLN